jgi:hypothetical protein
VNAGALQVGNGGAGQTGTGNVTVNSGGTIWGSGVVRGTNFTLADGATLRPGDGAADASHGTLSFTPATASGATFGLQGSIILGITSATQIDGAFGGALTLGDATYNAWVDGISGAGAHDRLVFNDPISGTGYALNFVTTTGSLQVVGSGFMAQSGQVFNLLDWGSLVMTNFTGFDVGTNFRDGAGDNGSEFDLPDISGSGYFWDVSRFTISGNIVVVPEPSRALLLMLGVAGCVLRRRRRFT